MRAKEYGNSWGADRKWDKEGAMYSLFWLAVTILDIVAVVSLLKSATDGTTKILWLLVIVLLPLLGMILYFAIGPGRKKAV
jgi:Phospholipase_D-nuclease N-terminal